MTAGGRLPYHLRPNKAVERLIFLQLLSYVATPLRLESDYDYVGLGGPQMEEFRLLQELFPEMSMLSIEREPPVLKRQRFNRPHTNVKCRLQKTEDFVLRVSDRRKLIVWLDYTRPVERAQQLADFQALIRNVRDGSILKITLNAAPATLGGAPGEAGLQAKRLEAFKKDFGRCFPLGLDEETVTNDRFPETLITIIDYLSSEAVAARPNRRFQPLTSAVYADGQQMLTVTGIVDTRARITNLLAVTKLPTWDFARLTWADPVHVDVPELTLKERITINQNLPKLAKQIAMLQRKLGFWVDITQGTSEEKLTNYVSFQRHYPYWGKVAI